MFIVSVRPCVTFVKTGLHVSSLLNLNDTICHNCISHTICHFCCINHTMCHICCISSTMYYICYNICSTVYDIFVIIFVLQCIVFMVISVIQCVIFIIIFVLVYYICYNICSTVYCICCNICSTNVLYLLYNVSHLLLHGYNVSDLFLYNRYCYYWPNMDRSLYEFSGKLKHKNKPQISFSQWPSRLH